MAPPLTYIVSLLQRARLVWLVGAALCLAGAEGTAQAAPSPVFPTERRQELSRELHFGEAETAEERAAREREKRAAEERAKKFREAYRNWTFDLSDTTVRIILLVLLVLLGAIVYRVLGDVSVRRRTRAVADDEDVDLENLAEERLVASGVSLSLLEQAERDERYDVAVRLLYIQLLKELQDADLIRYRKDYSSGDYRRQLGGHPLLPTVETVASDYARYWFGRYPLERLGYRLVHRRFTDLFTAVRETVAPTESYVR